MEQEHKGPSLLARAGAVVVLIVAAMIVLRLVVGFLSGFIWLAALILALVAIVWAWRTLSSSS